MSAPVPIPSHAGAACDCGASWVCVETLVTVRMMIDHWRSGHRVVCRPHLTPTIRTVATLVAQGATSATFVASPVGPYATPGRVYVGVDWDARWGPR